MRNLKLLNQILYFNLFTLLNDGYALDMYNNRLKSSFSGQLAMFEQTKNDEQNLFRIKSCNKRYQSISPMTSRRVWLYNDFDIYISAILNLSLTCYCITVRYCEFSYWKYQQLQELHAHSRMCVSLLFDSRNLQKQHQQL